MLATLAAQQPVAVEQGEASTGIVEVATASAGAERIQGRKLEHSQYYAEAIYSNEAVKDHRRPNAS